MVCESIFSLIFQLQLQSIAINIHTICFPRLYPRQPCTIFSSFYVSYYQYLDFTIYHSIFLYYVLSHNYIYYYNIIHFYLFKCHSNVITYLNVIFGNWKLQSKFWMKIETNVSISMYYGYRYLAQEEKICLLFFNFNWILRSHLHIYSVKFWDRQ